MDVLNRQDFIKNSGLKVTAVRGVRRRLVTPSNEVDDQRLWFEKNLELSTERSISIQHGHEIDAAHHKNQLQMIHTQGDAEAAKIKYNNQMYQKAVDFCFERFKERGKVANELQMRKDIKQFEKLYGTKLNANEVMRSVLSNRRYPKDPIIG
jgi:hypothetical protein